MIRVGHRGAAGHAPENSLDAIEKAIALGADFVELDIRRSRDGHLVIFHDERVERTTDGTGLLSDLTLAEIGRLTLANGLRIPTIHEALRTADGRVGVLWEIKAEGLAEQLCKEVEQRGFAHPVIYASFFHAELLDLRRREPRAQTMALLEGVPVNPTGFARDAQVTHVGLALDFLSTGLIEALRRARFSVFVYTVNDPADIARVKAIGVDGMISDFPERI